MLHRLHLSLLSRASHRIASSGPHDRQVLRLATRLMARRPRIAAVASTAASDASPTGSAPSTSDAPAVDSHIQAIREAKQIVPSPEKVTLLAEWCRKNMDQNVAYGQIVQLKANFVRVRLTSVEGLTDLEGRPSQQWPHRELLCIVRAVLKKMERRVFVGDRVRVTGIDWVDGRGMVEDLEERSSLIEEPAIANVDQLCIVFAAARPDFSPDQASRFMVTAEATALPVSVVVNKCDLVAPEYLEQLRETLRGWGYDPVCVSAKAGRGLDELRALLKDKTTVFAGPSGVGKSSLINAVRIMDARALQGAAASSEASSSGRQDGAESDESECDKLADLTESDLDKLLHGLRNEEAEELLGMPVAEFKLKYAKADASVRRELAGELEWFERAGEDLGLELERTGSVGRVTGLGTHTTRHVSLLDLPGGGCLADSPGFNKPTLDQVTTESLDACMPEIARIQEEHGSCRFPGCTHLHEPGCPVREQAWDRYEVYCAIRSEVEDREDLQMRRSASKKKRQGKVKVKAAKKGGEDRVEARLDSKKFRRKDRRLVNQELGAHNLESDDDRD